MSTSQVRAGSLVWDIEIAKQEEAVRKVEALGKKLDEALNRNRTGGRSPLADVGRDADQAANRVTAFREEFTRLNVQLRSGQISASQYGSSLKALQGNLQTTARATNLTAAEYKSLSTLVPQVSRAQATLGGTTAEVLAKTQALAGEIRRLRNDWQRTGQATTETKARLAELANETARYALELREADGGTVRFKSQLDQLAVAGRSAQATIDGIEGRMSRLGLASQVNLALQQQVVSQLYQYGPAGRIAAGSLGIVGGGLGAVSGGALLAVGGVAALGTVAASLAKTGIPEVKEMQAALNILKASGEQLDMVGLDRILRDAQEAAGSAGRQFAKSEISTALAEIVKAGVEANDAIRLLAPGMQLAVVTGQSLNDATRKLLANLRQFGLETTEAQRAADALAAADLAAAHGAAELSDGLATVGPIARAAGMSLEDTLGILVELDNKGLDPADKGATALRGTLAGLLDPTAEAVGVLESLGIKLRDSEGKARPLLTVLNELQKALNGNTEAAQNAAQIFDTRAITAILNMTDKSSQLAAALKDSAGAAERFADQVTRDDLEKAQTNLANAWKDMANTFSQDFAHDLTTITNALAGFLRLVGNFMERYPEAPWWTRGSSWQWLYSAGVIGNGQGSAPQSSGGRAGPDGIPLAMVTPFTKDYLTALNNLGDGGDKVVNVTAELIAKARELKAALDAAVAAGNPEAWAKATVRIDEFKDSSKDAALAWQAVVATADKTKPKVERTVNDIFKDLETKGLTAKNAALALGNTLEAQLKGVETRAKLVNDAISEMMQRPDVNEGDNPDRLAYLVRRAEELETLVGRLKRQIETLALPERYIAQVPEGSFSIAGVNVTPPNDPAAEQALKDLLANWQAAQKVVDDYNAALAITKTRLDVGLIDSEGEMSERLTATKNVINAMLPLWPRLSEEHKAFVEDMLKEAGRLEQQLEINAAKAEQTAERRQRQRERDIQTQLDRDDDNATAEGGMSLDEIKAWVKARREAEAEAAKQRRLAQNARRQEALNVQAEALSLGVQITRAFRAGSLEGLQELEQTILERLDEYGDSVLGTLFSGLLTKVRAATAELNAEAEAEARKVQETAARLALNARRAESMAIQQDAWTLGNQVGRAIREGSIDALRSLEAELVEKITGLGDDPIAALYIGVLTELRAGLKPLQDAANTTVESLRWQLVELRTKGAEPSSAAIQELVRRINELQLKAALDELRQKGVKNLSAFARSVLEANGILPKTVAETRKLSDTLRSLGDNDIATGLADVLDGIKAITEAGGDAEKVIAGLTTVLKGVAKVVEGLSSGDAFDVIKNSASIIGEGIGMAAGVPGVGQLVGAAFDLGRMIVQSISDAFTGDSPAARAIRDGLAGAVQSAFTTGILAALQKGENWRENLREGAKLAFLTALIEAFVKSTIVTAIMEPIMYAYSKMLAKGQYDAAKEYLANSLPAAINRAMTEVDSFVSSLPPGLIPTQPGGTPPPTNEPTGVFELPTATVSAIAAPEWARDLVNAGRLQMEASKAFASAVDLLVNQGITIKGGGGGSSSGGAAAAARAI